MRDGFLGLLMGRYSDFSTTTWWDRLWPLLVTAVLTLAIFWFVQLALVPKAEARKRREQRWEEDVLELGRLLTFEFSDAMDSLRHELWLESMREYEMPDYVPDDRKEELVREQHEVVMKARDTYRSVGEKVSWITERVVSLDPDSMMMRRFHVTEMALEVRGLDSIAMHRRRSAPVPTVDEINEAAGVTRKDLKNLVDAVKQLASGPTPRRGSIFDRIWSRVRQLMRKLKKN